MEGTESGALGGYDGGGHKRLLGDKRCGEKGGWWGAYAPAEGRGVGVNLLPTASVRQCACRGGSKHGEQNCPKK